MIDLAKPRSAILVFRPIAVGYQIEDSQVLKLQVRQQRTLQQTFNNRNLERLFGSFRSVKFFLTRDSLREVIAVR